MAEGAVQPDCVVVPTPALDHDLPLLPRMEDFAVEQLIAQLGSRAIPAKVRSGFASGIA